MLACAVVRSVVVVLPPVAEVQARFVSTQFGGTCSLTVQGSSPGLVAPR